MNKAIYAAQTVLIRDALNHADDRIRQQRRSVYDQLADRVAPLIEAYMTDLTTHDRAMIEGSPGVPFLHWTRQHGTHMVMLHPADDPSWPAKGVRIPYLFGHADRDHILKGVLSLARHCSDPHNGDQRCVLYCDGKTIRDVTPKQATTIAEEYAGKVRDAWYPPKPQPEYGWSY